MRKIAIGFMVILILAVCVGTTFAEIFVSNADEAAPFVIRYKDVGAAGTITITTNQVIVSDGGTTNSYIYGDETAPTLGGVVSDINSSTNSSGLKNFEAVLFCGLSADVVTNAYLLPLSATTLNASWSYAAKWDTSTCKHYDVATSIMIGSGGVSAGRVDRIFGFPTGTGASTINLYVNGTSRWLKLVATNPAALNDEIDVWVGNQTGFLRAANATTATTGQLGVSTVPR